MSKSRMLAEKVLKELKEEVLEGKHMSALDELNADRASVRTYLARRRRFKLKIERFIKKNKKNEVIEMKEKGKILTDNWNDFTFTLAMSLFGFSHYYEKNFLMIMKLLPECNEPINIFAIRHEGQVVHDFIVIGDCSIFGENTKLSSYETTNKTYPRSDIEKINKDFIVIDPKSSQVISLKVFLLAAKELHPRQSVLSVATIDPKKAFETMSSDVFIQKIRNEAEFIHQSLSKELKNEEKKEMTTLPSEATEPNEISKQLESYNNRNIMHAYKEYDTAVLLIKRKEDSSSYRELKAKMDEHLVLLDALAKESLEILTNEPQDKKASTPKNVFNKKYNKFKNSFKPNSENLSILTQLQELENKKGPTIKASLKKLHKKINDYNMHVTPETKKEKPEDLSFEFSNRMADFYKTHKNYKDKIDTLNKLYKQLKEMDNNAKKPVALKVEDNVYDALGKMYTLEHKIEMLVKINDLATKENIDLIQASINLMETSILQLNESITKFEKEKIKWEKITAKSEKKGTIQNPHEERKNEKNEKNEKRFERKMQKTVQTMRRNYQPTVLPTKPLEKKKKPSQVTSSSLFVSNNVLDEKEEKGEQERTRRALKVIGLFRDISERLKPLEKKIDDVNERNAIQFYLKFLLIELALTRPLGLNKYGRRDFRNNALYYLRPTSDDKRSINELIEALSEYIERIPDGQKPFKCEARSPLLRDLQAAKYNIHHQAQASNNLFLKEAVRLDHENIASALGENLTRDTIQGSKILNDKEKEFAVDGLRNLLNTHGHKAGLGIDSNQRTRIIEWRHPGASSSSSSFS